LNETVVAESGQFCMAAKLQLPQVTLGPWQQLRIRDPRNPSRNAETHHPLEKAEEFL
jgi:hypothetical protein